MRLDWIGTSRLSWRDAIAISNHLPVTSAVARAVRGEAALIGPTEYLLANAINVLRVISWQLGGNDKAPKPEPMTLPGMDVPATPDAPDTVRGDSLTTEQLDAILEDRIGWSKRQPKR